MSIKGMCPHCGETFKMGPGLTPVHDWPKVTRQVCPGSEQNWRNPDSDARPLWNGKPNPHINSDSGELIETLRHLLQQWEQRVVCPQCGQRYSDRACGPTHAVVMNLVRPNNADSGQALMSDLLQSELKPDLRKQVIHDDSHEGNDATS